MSINFLKMNGAGNDFVIVDTRQNSKQDNIQFTPDQISKISNRSNVGCDQFIIIENSASADALMEIYNSDGSKSGACGNATRCVAGMLMEEKGIDELNIQTAAGILKCKKNGDLISVNMGKPKFAWDQIPLLMEKNTDNFVVEEFEKFHFTAVNMGNPHIVTFLQEDLSDQSFLRYGSELEINSLFPQKTNVEFARILSSNHIKVRVWERGAGETLACGSGACAVAVAAIKKGLVERSKIKISFKGGDLFVEWKEDNSVIMSGGYTKVFAGKFDEGFL